MLPILAHGSFLLQRRSPRIKEQRNRSNFRELIRQKSPNTAFYDFQLCSTAQHSTAQHSTYMTLAQTMSVLKVRRWLQLDTVHIVKQMRPFEQPLLMLKSLPADEEIIMIKQMGDQGESCKWPLNPSNPYRQNPPRSTLTLFFVAVTAPAARSCFTTAACPFIAAQCSGVSPTCGARQRSDNPLAAQVRAPQPRTHDSMHCQTSKDKEKEVEQVNSLPAKSTMPRKSGLGTADFRRDGNSVGGFLSIPESNNDKEEGA